MRQVYRFKQIMMLGCATLFTLLSFFFSAYILGFLVHGNQQASEIVAEGQRYLHIILLTFIPIAFSTAITSSLRDIGRVKIIMYSAVFSTLLNTAGNYILIYGNFGAPRCSVCNAHCPLCGSCSAAYLCVYQKACILRTAYFAVEGAVEYIYADV